MRSLQNVRYPFDAWYVPRETPVRFWPWLSTCEGERITIVLSIPFAGAIVIATPLLAR
ncbi:hypothetical protein [Rhodococcoides fascians]|uniref:hypothetical protein n=1 Tax=Rhodococcoides fascians TaxID=1828 RepID=UPI0012D334C8|nr:hypothetical protein [Rhodococcus fascians]